MISLPDSVRVVEMLPRDGLQRLDRFVPTDEKVAMVNELSATGVDEVEITSFTHPDAVPNLRDADEVAAGIDRHDDVTYRALVPNAVGAERAVDADLDKVNALTTVSETYCRKNQGMTTEENLEALREVVEVAHGAGLEVEAGIATSFFCPYEGRIPRERTLSVLGTAVEAGVDEVTLATSMGMANPVQVSTMLDAVFERYPDLDVGLHLHDTNGMSLANTLVAMQAGVDRFDTSVCGLGGGVILSEGLTGVGNTPTEDLLLMCREMGLDFAADFDAVADAAESIRARLDLPATSHVLKGGTPEAVLENA
jgi:hydroxymethylglutaryl-CoA lyase